MKIKKIGTRLEVYNKKALKTSGGLMKKDLIKKNGKIISKKLSNNIRNRHKKSGGFLKRIASVFNDKVITKHNNLNYIRASKSYNFYNNIKIGGTLGNNLDIKPINNKSELKPRPNELHATVNNSIETPKLEPLELNSSSIILNDMTEEQKNAAKILFGDDYINNMKSYGTLSRLRRILSSLITKYQNEEKFKTYGKHINTIFRFLEDKIDNRNYNAEYNINNKKGYRKSAKKLFNEIGTYNTNTTQTIKKKKIRKSMRHEIIIDFNNYTFYKRMESVMIKENYPYGLDILLELLFHHFDLCPINRSYKEMQIELTDNIIKYIQDKYRKIRNPDINVTNLLNRIERTFHQTEQAFIS